MRTVCFTCEGKGWLLEEYKVVELDSAQGGTGVVHLNCRTCGGDGWLAGFAVPA